MKITEHDLIALYSDMDADQLLEMRAAGGLTELAEKAICSVLAKRKLTPEQEQTMAALESEAKDSDAATQGREGNWEVNYNENLDDLEPEQKIAAMCARNMGVEQILQELINMGMEVDEAEELVAEIVTKQSQVKANSRLMLYRFWSVVFALATGVLFFIEYVNKAQAPLSIYFFLSVFFAILTVVVVFLMQQEIKRSKQINKE